MIGLSPLSWGHPLRFQPKWVRPSTGSYPRFSLPQDSSPGFASAACDSLAILKARFRCGSVDLNLAARRDSLAHSTKGTPSQRKGCSDCLWAHGFRYCFTPLSGCFSPFPHGTGSLSVTGECSALEGGPPGFGPGFTCPALLGILVSGPHGFAYGALTRCGRPFHAVPLPCGFVTAPRWAAPGRESRNPRAATPAAYTRPGLGWCAFARRYSRNLG